jgi:ribosomal RNA-processing protein 8
LTDINILAMSLFASSFDASTQAGPSKVATQAPTKAPKRKRPSTGSVNDDQLKGMQRNLEKLIGKVERGNVAGKGEGKEAMGTGEGKKKGKQNRHEEEEPRAGKFGEQNGNKRQKQNVPQTSAKSPKGRGSASNKSTPNVKAEQKKEVITPRKSGKPEPAELPMPHIITPKSGAGGDEGDLTSLQKGMKSKLEGARFRYAVLELM